MTAMKAILISLIGCSLGALGLRSAHASTFNGASPLAWSERMAESELARYGATASGPGRLHNRWDYAESVVALSLVRLAEASKQPRWRELGLTAVTRHVEEGGAIRGYAESDYNIDHIAPGKVLLAALATDSTTPGLSQAVQHLRGQMARHPRTADGGFWHKQRYPQQMWLDGLYMASPFLAQYARQFNEAALFDEVVQQIVLMDRHSFDATTGLHRHGWDAVRGQSWAERDTGRSPNLWSRGIGWYAMALVDVLEFLPADHPRRSEVVAILRRLATGAMRWQDESGAWWQVTDQGTRKGNYLEASGSSMLVYALAKGINQGNLPRADFEAATLRGYQGLITRFVRQDRGNLISLTNVCEVAGLGASSPRGRWRDGSFNYYLSERVVDNDPKGTGPFILAGIEVQRLLDPGSK